MPLWCWYDGHPLPRYMTIFLRIKLKQTLFVPFLSLVLSSCGKSAAMVLSFVYCVTSIVFIVIPFLVPLITVRLMGISQLMSYNNPCTPARTITSTQPTPPPTHTHTELQNTPTHCIFFFFQRPFSRPSIFLSHLTGGCRIGKTNTLCKMRR